MNDKKDGNHWQSLASQLGAEPQDEADATPKPLDTDTDADVDVPTDTERKSGPSRPSKPPRVPSDWGGLANELGIDVPTPQAADEAMSDEPPAQDDGEPPESVVREIETDRPGPAFTPPVDEHDEPSVTESIEQALDDAISYFEPDSSQETDSAEVLIEDESEEATGSRGLEAEEAESTERTSRRRRGRKRQRTRPKPEREELEDEPDDSADADDAEDVETQAEDESGETAPARRRRRRRRRPAKKPDESGDAQIEEAEEAATEATDSEGETEPSEDHEETSHGARRSKHRKIPTWDEAIEVIVRTNLDSRSKDSGSKGASRGNRRRGRGGKRS